MGAPWSIGEGKISDAIKLMEHALTPRRGDGSLMAAGGCGRRDTYIQHHDRGRVCGYPGAEQVYRPVEGIQDGLVCRCRHYRSRPAGRAGEDFNDTAPIA